MTDHAATDAPAPDGSSGSTGAGANETPATPTESRLARAGSPVIVSLVIALALLGASAWWLVPPILENRERQYIADHGMESSATLIGSGAIAADGRVPLTFEYRDADGNRHEVTRLASAEFELLVKMKTGSRMERVLIRYLRDEPARVMFIDEGSAPAPAAWVHSLAIAGLLMLSYALARIMQLLRLRARRRKALALEP